VGYRAFINQGREMWDQRGLDTLVVASVNSAGSGSVTALFYWPDRHLLHLSGNQSFCVPGGVHSQGWNLKELTENHHQAWSVWLNSTQHGKFYQARTWLWLPDW